MAIQYMPGWWDTMQQQGFPQMFEKLFQTINPDPQAQRDFKQMVQQNPALLEQLSNMDQTTRDMFVKNLGFKKQNPIAGLGEGEELKKRKRVEAFMKTADPKQVAEKAAAESGVTPLFRLQREETVQKKEDTLADQRISKGILDAKTGEINLKVLESEFGKMQKLEAVDAPDNMAALARDYFLRKPIPTEVLQKVMTDDSLAPAFKGYVDLYKMQYEVDARKTLQSMKSPQDKMILLQRVDADVDNLRQRAAQLRVSTMGKGGLLNSAGLTQEQKNQYLQDVQELKVVEDNLRRMEQAQREILSDVDSRVPKPSEAPAGSTTTPAVQIGLPGFGKPQTPQRLPLNQIR